MRVNIKGLTGVTITFNTLGLVLRGEKTATNIDINTDDQMRELVTLKNANLVSFERADAPIEPIKISTELPKPIEKVLENSVKSLKAGIASEQIVLPKEAAEEIEDAPTEKTEKVKEAPAAKPKAKMGRPKGSLNKKAAKQIKQTKQAAQVPTPKTAKPRG